MRLLDAESVLVKSRSYWLVSMFYENAPDESKFWLCFSEEEAKKKFDDILPIEDEIDAIQNRVESIYPNYNHARLTRKEIIDQGEWANPFGNPNEKHYNGYASIYRVRRFDNGKEAYIGYGVPKRRIRILRLD